MPLSLFHPEGEHGHSAILSPCRTYRYTLERRWGAGPFVLFVGLNPSTADETTDDQTIRRCISYAKAWGYGGLLMGNLFAYRATDPRDLPAGDEAVGPDTDVWLTTLSVRAGLAIAAWGANGRADARSEEALAVLGDVYCLGTTKGGYPRHPSRLPNGLMPQPFRR